MTGRLQNINLLPRIWQIRLPLILLAVFCISIAFITQPPILGWWEGSAIFHSFAPENIWPNTRIHPKANIGGYEYAVLDLSRYVANVLGLSLLSIRIVPIIFGLISLLLMYRILSRWHSSEIAILVTALFAVNQVFLTFQHQLIIPIVTLAGILFVIDRFQIVDSDSITAPSAVAFGLACAFSSLHYQIGRYLMLAIVFFWLTRGMGIKLPVRSVLENVWVLKRNNWKYLLFAGLGFVIMLEVFHVQNMGDFISKSFLSPQNEEHASGLTEAITTFKFNSPLIIDSLMGTDSFYGNHSSDLIVSVPYQLLNPLLFAFALIGLVAIVLVRTNRRRSAFLVFLLVLTTVPIALSDLVEVEPGTTLSPYRMFYVIIPLYFLVAAGLTWVFTSLKGRDPVLLKIAVATVVAFIGFQTFQYVNEANRFQDFLEQTECGFQDDRSGQKSRLYSCQLSSTIADGDTNQRDPDHSANFTYYERDILPYLAYAKSLSQLIEQVDLPKDKALIIDAPVLDFEPKPLQTHYTGFNFHQVFLAFYLAEQGVDVNYYVPYSEDDPVSLQIDMRNHVLVHISDVTRRYPLRFDNGESAMNPYINSGPYHYTLRSTSGLLSDTRMYLVTTEEEKAQAIKQIRESKLDFISVRL